MGDAYRLKDAYEDSKIAFTNAKKNAKTEIEFLESEIGLASAKKNTRNGIEELNNSLQELECRTKAKNIYPLAIARALFQQGNLAFATCRWNESIKLYNHAESILNTTYRSHASLLIDIWKGYGDVLLHMGDIEKANKLCTMMIDLAAKHMIPLMDVRAHAKLCQYAGDVLRHMSCQYIIYGANIEMLRISDWWYNRAIELYQNNELQLGVCLSQYKIAQSCFIRKEFKSALELFISLREQFDIIFNYNWVYKCDIMIIAIDNCDNNIIQKYYINDIHSNIRNAIKKNNLSPYQVAWAKLILDKNKNGAINDFKEIGAVRLADGLESRGIDFWVGSEF